MTIRAAVIQEVRGPQVENLWCSLVGRSAVTEKSCLNRTHWRKTTLDLKSRMCLRSLCQRLKTRRCRSLSDRLLTLKKCLIIELIQFVLRIIWSCEWKGHFSESVETLTSAAPTESEFTRLYLTILFRGICPDLIYWLLFWYESHCQTPDTRVCIYTHMSITGRRSDWSSTATFHLQRLVWRRTDELKHTALE